MPAKQLSFNDEARQAMGRGVSIVATAVATTLGPKGRNVVIQSPSGPIVTKDGVTVAKHVELEDPYEDLGAQLCKQVSAKTNDVAGDGTTTATVLANALVVGGLKYISSGGNPINVKVGMEYAANKAVEIIEDLAKPIESKEQITFVATISGNETEVGQIVADAMEAVGKDGVITIEESRGRETSLSLVEGMKFDKGYVSAFFVNNAEKMECRHTDPFILLYDGKISDSAEILPILTKVNEQKKPIVIIADNVDGPALQMLVINVHKGAMPWVAVKTPGFAGQKKEYLYDIAALTGGDVISSEMGTTLENCTVDNLGKAKSIVINKESTTIIGGEGDNAKIDDRISQLKVDEDSLYKRIVYHKLKLPEGKLPSSKSESRYKIKKLIGEGSIGNIFAAQDFNFDREVALKVPKKTDSSGHGRDDFIKEATVSAGLEHPNIIPVYDLNIDNNGSIYMSMRKVNGHSLKEYIDSVKNEDGTLQLMKIEEILLIFLKICDAVAYAHSKGHIHQDIKPENIMIGGHGA